VRNRVTTSVRLVLEVSSELACLSRLVNTLPRAGSARAAGAMGEGSGKGGSVPPPVDAVFAAVGVRAHSDAEAPTSGEIPEPAEPTAADLEAEAAALHARLRETSEHLASLADLGRSGLAEVLGMGGGVEAEAESLLEAFAGMESGLEGVAARLRETLGDDEGTGEDDADLDARIAAAEARLAATRRARDEAAAAAAAEPDADETRA